MSNKNIIEAVKNAEEMGWSKFKTESGTLMVVITQQELDLLLEHAAKKGIKK